MPGVAQEGAIQKDGLAVGIVSSACVIPGERQNYNNVITVGSYSPDTLAGQMEVNVKASLKGFPLSRDSQSLVSCSPD